MLIDPDGRSEGEGDGIYTVDKKGSIKKVANNNNAPNGYAIVYNKDAYDVGKRDYDKSGEKNGLSFKRSELGNPKITKYNILDHWSDLIISSYYNFSAEIENQNVADNFISFFEKNTDVEWGKSIT